jgi:lipoic acid synthetase
MDLDYVVFTSVDRDDLPLQGSDHFAECIRQVKIHSPKTLVEVLIPDFCGRKDLLYRVVDANPSVLAHNIECVRRMTPKVRDPRASYDQSLQVLLQVKEKAPEMLTKSSIMVGVGETDDEVIETMADLRAVGVDFLTIGQYLRPTTKHLKVADFVHPDQFEKYRKVGEGLGFIYVASGPLVRSSYRAGEFFIKNHLKQQAELEL